MTFLDLYQDNNQNKQPTNESGHDQSDEINPVGSAGGIAQRDSNENMPMKDIENTPEPQMPDYSEYDD